MAAPSQIKVLVHGASGRMGREVLAALCRHPAVEPVGAVDIKATEEYLSLPDGSGIIPFGAALEPVLNRVQPQVVVDFSIADATMNAARVAAKHKVNLVIGTTGLSEVHLKEIEALCRQYHIGAFVAPNFSLGAVVLTHLAKIAARFFDYADVVELHHETKIDAPSGTALAIAQAMLAGHGKPFLRNQTEKQTLAGTRGGESGGISIHSVRLPGFVASHEVVFGTLGQFLTLRHDSTSRESFMPGVLMAIQQVVKQEGFIYGLDKLLGL